MMSTQGSYSAFKTKEKFVIVFIATLCGFLGPISGNIYVPLIRLTAENFDTSIEIINGTVSVFMVVFAFAPLLWSVWSDSIGRKPIILISLVIFIIANILIAALPANVSALYVLRILQAIGSSTMAVGIGCIADISLPQTRATFISYYMIGPQLGPILGPILGILGAKTDWKWNFGLLAILGFVSISLCFMFLPETLRSLVGDGSSVAGTYLHYKLNSKIGAEKNNLSNNKRSLKVYFTVLRQIPVLFCSISGGIVFAGFYSMLLSFSKALSTDYGFSNTEVCLSFLCPGFSLVLGSLIVGRVSDYIRKHSRGNDDPERRFLIQLIGQFLFLISILMYAWLLENRVHSGYLFLSMFIGGFSLSSVLITNTAYLSEYSKRQLATFVAVGNFFRNIGATISSASIEPLISIIGYGWSITIFGACVASSVIFTLLIIHNGSRWRENGNLKT